MEQIYNEKMSELGYNQFMCDIFLNWEDVKDEILLPDRKKGSGNGTVHVFLGAADAELRKEFPNYYKAVTDGEDTSVGAIKITHYFTQSNVLSMLGYVCQYYKKRAIDFSSTVIDILANLDDAKKENGLLVTSSFLKLSIGSNKLRPYFKQFEDKGVFHKIIRQLLLPNSAYKIALYKNAHNEYAAFWLIGFDDLDNFSADANKENIKKPLSKISKFSLALQQIYYGAPGTGKSYEINALTKPYSTIRTTFHPDSDYSTFVGAYKPVMAESTVYGLQGEPIKVSKGGDEKVELKEPRITYTFVKQAFLKAYLGAWQKYAKGDDTTEPQFLVIEEINRGNCAQIFGDLFQLLDRSDNGFSTYPIEADSDLQSEIRKAFAYGGEYALGNELDVDDAVEGYTSNYDDTLSDDIKDGRVLLLPNNLYIWATMNTSDQSLFPVDSAFKRRWDWRYVKIADAGKGWKIKCGDEYCDWWKFVEEINKKIAKETSSDDKKLGYFFCKPPKDSDTISEDKFVGKVLFYLWNDVFKDGDISLFKVSDEPEAEICFDAFYGSDNKVNVEAIRTFLVSVVGEANIKNPKATEEQADPVTE